MAVVLTGQWNVALKLLKGAVTLFPRAADVALRRIAIDVEGDIRSKIKSGPPPAQSGLTKVTGGLGKPLNRAGDLGNSVDVVHPQRLAYFIGIPRSAGSYSLAEVHENGAVVVQNMSDRMRRFLHVKLRATGDPPPNSPVRMVVSQIPARPFVEPVFAALSPVFVTKFTREFSLALGGKYGKV